MQGPTVTVTVVIRAAVTPVPTAQGVLYTIVPFSTTAQHARHLSRLATAAPQIRFTSRLRRQLKGVLTPRGSTARDTLIRHIVLLVNRALLPVLSLRRRLALTHNITCRARVPYGPPFINKGRIVPNRALQNRVATRIAVRRVGVTGHPRVVTLRPVGVSVPGHQFSITRLMHNVQNGVSVRTP